MFTTYRNLINSSLRLVGVIGEGESATSAQASDAVVILNEILDTFNAKGANLSSTSESSCPLIAGQAVYFVGPTGDIVVANGRPSLIKNAFIRDNSSPANDYQLTLITSGEYATLTSKDTQTSIPYIAYYNGTIPNGQLTLYPVPSSGYFLHIYFDSLFATTKTLDTTVQLAPAYSQAIRYRLAVLLATEYNVEVSPMVIALAQEAESIMQNNNFENPHLGYNIHTTGYYNIKTDSFR